MIRLALLLRYAESLYGVPYIYGGNNPLQGLDCGGLVCEILRAGGIIGKQDYSVQMLWDAFQADWLHVHQPRKGAVAFFGNAADNLTHCGFCVGNGLMVESGGGRRSTLTTSDAAKAGAFVRLRPVDSRSDFFAFRLPKY